MSYLALKDQVSKTPKAWLITGAAGLIGFSLVETLLKLDQRVVRLENFSTGHQHNLDDVQALVNQEQWSHFDSRKGDIRALNDCSSALEDGDYVLHQAAVGSVSRSIENPKLTNQSNIDGFLNMLVASFKASIKQFFTLLAHPLMEIIRGFQRLKMKLVGLCLLTLLQNMLMSSTRTFFLRPIVWNA